MTVHCTNAVSAQSGIFKVPEIPVSVILKHRKRNRSAVVQPGSPSSGIHVKLVFAEGIVKSVGRVF